MKFFETSEDYSLNKFTYVNLRWIAYIGQILTILLVQFFFKYSFNYIPCLFFVFIGIITNLILRFKIRENLLSNNLALYFLSFDILQIGALFFFTGGNTNPFIFLIIIPAVFSSQYLNFISSIILVIIIMIVLFILNFFYYDLPHPGELHFHAPDYYLYSIPVSISIGVSFLVFFGFKFGEQSRIRKKAFDKTQELIARENELLSLGAQAAASAHSLGTPLSTILLTVTELQKDYGENEKIKKDLDLLVSQSKRCREILKNLSLNPTIEDEFLNHRLTINDYIVEIVRTYREISMKEFTIDLEKFKNPISSNKSKEIMYGLRNFIGNANKFSKKKVEIFLISDKENTTVIIRDDGPGFPKDLIDKDKLGEPYIRTADQKNISKYGLGLGTFIGKTLLEKNFAKINFYNLSTKVGAEVKVKWKNKDLTNI
tara:strand:- start:1591 stop:2877 length:1287 start_codon:yes stop_codon:yes gene_type:complete